MTRALDVWVFGAVLLLLVSPVALAESEPSSPAELERALSEVAVSTAGVTVLGAPRRARQKGELPFTRLQGNQIGIDHLALLTPDRFSPPFWNGHGLAGGDIDKDGFQDVAIASRYGVKLYRNHGGDVFTELPLPIPAIAELDVYSVALVDLNDDTWLDLVLTTYTTGNFIVLSDAGTFGPAGLSAIADPPTVLSSALTFGDIDEDGDLDAAFGNWFYGTSKEIPPADATNQLLIWDNGAFHATPMTEITGETHSVLFTDFDMDDHLDLIVGNDFLPPDIFYRGDGKGGLEMIKRADGVIPISTDTTMSIDTADFNNDMRLDIYIAQIAAGATGRSTEVKMRVGAAYCDDLNRKRDRELCSKATFYEQRFFEFGARHQAGHIQRCKLIQERETRFECAAMMILKTAINANKPELCERMPSGQEDVAHRCRLYFKPSQHGAEADYATAIPVKPNENVLLVAMPDGSFEDRATDLGVDVTGWSWTGRFMDLDNDEWQDLYVVNGLWPEPDGSPQKFFLKNLGGRRFTERTDEFGLQNYMLQNSYVAADFDNDGDLDLLVNTTHGPLWFYRNNETRNNAILFELRDSRANHYCIGCKVRVFYGESNVKGQIREMKSGGGFHSFDPPVLHFGLGPHKSVGRIEVTWSTGEVTKIDGKLPANVLYTISRGAISPGDDPS